MSRKQKGAKMKMQLTLEFSSTLDMSCIADLYSLIESLSSDEEIVFHNLPDAVHYMIDCLGDLLEAEGLSVNDKETIEAFIKGEVIPLRDNWRILAKGMSRLSNRILEITGEEE